MHFNNKAVRQWLARRGSYLTVAAAYSHVGSVEAVNKMMIDRMRKLTGQDLAPIVDPKTYNTAWTDTLDSAVQQINDRIIPWLGNYSPRQILFGRIGKAPSQLHSQAFVDREVMEGEVEKAFDTEQERRKDRDHPRVEREWQPQQLVLVRDSKTDNTHLAANKMLPKWNGPFRIGQVFDWSVTLSTMDNKPVLAGQRINFQ